MSDIYTEGVLVEGYCYPRGKPDDYNGVYLNDSTLEEHAKRLVGIPIHNEHPVDPRNHEDTVKVGEIVNAEKDEKGVRVMIKLYTDSPDGWNAVREVQQGKLHSLTIGGGAVLDKPGGTVLGHRITEVSLTADPALEGTKLTSMQRVPKSHERLRRALENDLISRMVYNQSRDTASQVEEPKTMSAATPQHVPTPSASQQQQQQQQQQQPDAGQNRAAAFEELLMKQAAEMGLTPEEAKWANQRVEQRLASVPASDNQSDASDAKRQKTAGGTIEVDGKTYSVNEIKAAQALLDKKRARREEKEKTAQMALTQANVGPVLDWFTRAISHVGKDPQKQRVINTLANPNAPALDRAPLYEIGVAASRLHADTIHLKDQELQAERNQTNKMRGLLAQQEVELARLHQRTQANLDVRNVSSTPSALGKRRGFDNAAPSMSYSSAPSAPAAPASAAGGVSESSQNRARSEQAVLQDLGLGSGPTWFDRPTGREMLKDWS